ncbi:MAG TPA: NADH-quinone oxidoreductase subunit L [Clostridia bacterium]|nr:NADH-quinone oxidoreductase subunit L [Clostridia bacterium]
MSRLLPYLWIIPVLPLVAAAVTALLKQSSRRLSATLAIGSMTAALLLSLAAFIATVQSSGAREVFNFPWFQIGQAWLHLGWMLDPLAAVMLVMVCLVGLLIFVYSVGYMAQDPNFTRFFCFLSLFAAAMLGLIIANSLLLLFICWELVGLTSYLLIGFWFQKPSAAAAAKKAFITTRIGDLAFLLGMVWLYSETGTLLFYHQGDGCLEGSSLVRVLSQTIGLGMTVSTAIGLLIFCGAIGKSGQVPLHVWLPDAMEGPTPVSALIHAATMVAAGVFLVARVYPLMAAHFPGESPHTFPLQVITWIGAITALLASTIAVAQTDVKRILAYSTVSQLGFMMLGLGTGGVAVGMFHLITHAFFKALLFLGAGSVIHGSHDEQDIRRMGGLRQLMPVTFATYAIGMMALSGVPIFFSGFWSKDEILHAAHAWPVSHLPFYLAVTAALLTAFYMTRQVCYVFLGASRRETAHPRSRHHDAAPHESPRVMTVPLVVLAVFTIVLGFLGTPAWPWFQKFLEGQPATPQFNRLLAGGTFSLMVLSAVIAGAGIGLGYWFYGRRPIRRAEDPDALRRLNPQVYSVLQHKYYFDELYSLSVVRMTQGWAAFCDWLDRRFWSGGIRLVSLLTLGFSWINRLLDEYVVNAGFDRTCRQLAASGKRLSRTQTGQVQSYLRVIGAALVVLVLLLLWGCQAT